MSWKFCVANESICVGVFYWRMWLSPFGWCSTYKGVILIEPATRLLQINETRPKSSNPQTLPWLGEAVKAWDMFALMTHRQVLHRWGPYSARNHRNKGVYSVHYVKCVGLLQLASFSIFHGTKAGSICISWQGEAPPTWLTSSACFCLLFSTHN